MNDLHCPMIHGGLMIDLKSSNKIRIGNCCLLPPKEISSTDKIWSSPALIPLRKINNKNQWFDGCNCRYLEEAGQESFRTGTLKMFGKEKNLPGPQRLDLMFDIGCNLACRTCGPHSSTFWQKHLIDNKIQNIFPITSESKVDEMIAILETLDLSKLRLVVFCGGETLLGSGYWKVAQAISELANPEQITLSFQTNGTQSISEKYFELIEKFQLLKLNISLDAIDQQFEYLRWPASWNQVTDNILSLSDTLPVNHMFLIEETISVFNLFYQDRLENWIRKNFNTNRLGDKVDHTRHLAFGKFSINNITNSYLEELPATLKRLIPLGWKENPTSIHNMLFEIKKFDKMRNQNWEVVFPEVYEFYKRFINSGQ